MIQLPVYDKRGKQVETLDIDEAALGTEIRPALLKQAYVMFHSNRRQGSARTQSRGEVAGSTKKIYRQKGTGSARQGTKRTNTRRGGGVAFAKRRTHEDFRVKMPKQMRRLANRNALLAKLVDSEVKCLDDLRLEAPRTRDLQTVLAAVGIDRSCLIALDAGNRNAVLSARNLPNVTTILASQLNAFDLLNHRYLLTDRASLVAFLDGMARGASPEPERGPAPKPERAAAPKRQTREER
jgi:large subunit ribosomal protein L4